MALQGALQGWGGGRTRRGGVSGAPASLASPAGVRYIISIRWQNKNSALDGCALWRTCKRPGYPHASISSSSRHC